MPKLYQKTLKTRSGATSFYVTIFAALLFTIIAVGFVTVIMSEVSQTVNDELSQSAYDSALAGVEDAKLAIMKCVEDGGDCKALNSNECTALPETLERDHTNGEVIINEKTTTDASNEMLQAYTCVIISNNLSDYRSYLGSTDTDRVRIVPLRTADIDSITGIRISWHASTDNNDYAYRNIDNSGRVSFAPISQGDAIPPTISVQFIQTANQFSLKSSEIDYSQGNTTDRGTIFLVPTNRNNSFNTTNNHIANTGTISYQIGAEHGVSTASSGFVKANDKAQTNNPYLIRCADAPGAEEFACSATIELPKPTASSDGKRNPENTILIISMPYNQPSTSFSVELCTDAAASCNTTANFIGAQYAIDSTGRANDVFNRVEARVELSDIYFPYPEYALHLTGTGDTLIKNFWTTTNFGYGNNNCWYTNNNVAKNACSRSSGQLNN